MTNPRPARPFPAAKIIAACRGGRLVVIAPHPDDETLGCGLLIARAVRQGCRVAVIALTDGDASHPESVRWPPPALARVRRAELRRALARLGAGAVAIRFMHYGDGAVARDGRGLALMRLLTSFGAGAVVVASPADHHPDHQAAFRLATTALRGTPIPLFTYAVWSRAGGAAGPRVRDPHLASKRRAIAAHRSQTSDYIADDPRGFRLNRAVLATLVDDPEVFAQVR